MDIRMHLPAFSKGLRLRALGKSLLLETQGLPRSLGLLPASSTNSCTRSIFSIFNYLNVKLYFIKNHFQSSKWSFPVCTYVCVKLWRSFYCNGCTKLKKVIMSPFFWGFTVPQIKRKKIIPSHSKETTKSFSSRDQSCINSSSYCHLPFSII